jgi:hypothetical protein
MRQPAKVLPVTAVIALGILFLLSPFLHSPPDDGIPDPDFTRHDRG